MAGSFQSNSAGGVPNTIGLPAVRGFMNGESAIFEYPYSITGVTKDSLNAPLAFTPVVLFRTADNSVAGLVTSDANGNYRVDASPSIQHYAVAPGSTVAGVTVNTLVGM